MLCYIIFLFKHCSNILLEENLYKLLTSFLSFLMTAITEIRKKLINVINAYCILLEINITFITDLIYFNFAPYKDSL